MNIDEHNNKIIKETLNDVVKALNQIGERFYSLPNHYFLDGEIKKTESFKELELRFMNEFSTRFSNLIQNETSYQRLEYDFEIPKKFMWSGQENLEIRKTFIELSENPKKEVDMLSYFTTYPDFLVHAGQDNTNEENQKLIIEAKVNQNTRKGEIFKDIFHTFIYSNEYNFQCSIMLLVHFDEEKWVNLLNEYVSKGYYTGKKENLKKIFVVFKKTYDAIENIFSLYELLETPLCPECNQSMKIRTAKKGNNVGSVFWGCSNFPKCKATKKYIQ